MKMYKKVPERDKAVVNATGKGKGQVSYKAEVNKDEDVQKVLEQKVVKATGKGKGKI